MCEANVFSETSYSLGSTCCFALSFSFPPRFTWAYSLICVRWVQTLSLISLKEEWKSFLGPRSALLSWSNVSLIGSQILLALIIQGGP